MSNKIETFLSWMGKEFKQGFGIFQKYAPDVLTIAGAVFPAEAAALKGVQVATGLIASTVVSAEQKYAAEGKQTGTGASKLADVTSIVAPAVIQLLSTEGIVSDTGKVSTIVGQVADLLNAKPAPVPAATA